MIRVLKASDGSAFRALRLESFQESPLAFSESYEDEKVKSVEVFSAELVPQGTPPEYYLLGAFDHEQTLVGFVKFKRDQRSKARHKSMVHAMYVKPAFRGHGIGRKLMLEVIRRAREMPGLEQIHLWVLHTDRSASAFYASLGFVNQGPFVRKDMKIGEVYVDAEYMVLNI